MPQRRLGNVAVLAVHRKGGGGARPVELHPDDIVLPAQDSEFGAAHRSSLGDGCGAYVLSVLVAPNRRGQVAVEKRRAVGPTREVPAHHPAVVVGGSSCSQQRSGVRAAATVTAQASRPLLHSPSATEIFPATIRGGPLAQEGGGGG